MKTKQLQLMLERFAVIHESNGAVEKAAMLRGFTEAIAPLAAADVKQLIPTLTCGQPVDTKGK